MGSQEMAAAAGLLIARRLRFLGRATISSVRASSETMAHILWVVGRTPRCGWDRS